MSFNDLNNDLRDIVFGYWSPSKELRHKRSFIFALWGTDTPYVYGDPVPIVDLYPKWVSRWERHQLILDEVTIKHTMKNLSFSDDSIPLEENESVELI